MARPQHIILVRHGESQGNVNKDIYLNTPDYAVKLTEKGKKQAEFAGNKMRELTGDVPIKFYVSSYHRTRQTFQGLAKAYSNHTLREDPRLREQEWSGKLRPAITTEAERDAYGTFYYRFDGGESCADIYDRVSSFLDTLHRDFEKEEFPNACCLVTHGMTLRVFLLRWFASMVVEDFELLANPENCCRIVLELQSGGKYKIMDDQVLIDKGIISALGKYKEARHNYQFSI